MIAKQKEVDQVKEQMDQMIAEWKEKIKEKQEKLEERPESGSQLQCETEIKLIEGEIKRQQKLLAENETADRRDH